MSKWTYKNIVPGHTKGKKQKRGKNAPHFTSICKDCNLPLWRAWEHRLCIKESREWYKPFQSKPIKRKERRGQAKPRG